MKDFYVYDSLCGHRHKLTPEQIQENLEYDKLIEKQEANAILYTRKWSKEKKITYFKVLFKEYDMKEIYEWIEKIGLDEAFRKTYALFGDDID